MSSTQNRPYSVEERCGMPVYVEARTLPELPDRPSQIDDESVPPGKRIRAGAARVDVTPSEFGGLWGFGGVARPCTGVHDHLYVRALVLDNGHEKIAIISWDRLQLHADGFEVMERTRREINKRTGIPQQNVLISMTHTHSGCDAEFGKVSVEAVSRAWENMKDARIGVGSKMIYGIGSNRRMPDGTGLWGSNEPNPDRPMDNECGVIRVEDDNRNLIAVVVNYTAHPSVLRSNNTLVSGDYAGIGMLEMEKRLGGDVVALFLQGCCGDTGTHTFRTSGTMPEAERLGGKLADEALGILEHIDVIRWVRLTGKNRMIELPQKQFDPKNPTTPPIVEGGTSIRDEIQALVIGDSLILSVGSMEAFVEIGLAVKDASPFKHTFALAYSNGPPHGYLPSPHGYAVKDPDAQQTPFSPDAPNVLVAETLKLAGELKA